MGPGTPSGYLNFDLLLENGRGKGKYRARVMDSPAGEDEEQVHLRLPPIEAALQTLASPDDHPQSRKQAAKLVGRELFEAVFSGRVGTLYKLSQAEAKRDGRGLRLRLRLTKVPELARLPWEYLYEEPVDLFLGTNAETPISRYLELPAKPLPLEVEPPLKILVVIANPGGDDSLGAEREAKLVENALAGLVAAGRVVLERLRPATLQGLIDRARGEPVHILHFVGHGGFDAACDTGYLLFEDGTSGGLRVDQEQLGALLGKLRSLRLVVLNACEGACASPSDSFSGVAQALVRKGIPAVVAMQFEIEAELGLAFARGFYGRIAVGEPVDRALAEVRWELRVKDEVDWGAPVLHMRSPDGKLFSLPPSPPPPEGTGTARPPGQSFRGAVLLRRSGWAWPLAAAVLLGVFLWWQGIDANPPECPSPPGLGMRFVRIERGTFRMGSDEKPEDERPAHQVTLRLPFCLGVYEVTQEQWAVVMAKGEKPASGSPGKRLPAGRVSVEEVQEFLRRLEALDPGARYRLPTEAEWEYAARAGSTRRLGFSEDGKDLPLYGNCISKASEDRFDGPAPVGSFRPNPWGLHDMQGNVWEWVEDWYGPYTAGPQVDPKGPASGEERVRRGGGWDSDADHCRPGRRSSLGVSSHYQNTGFRVVREIR